MIRCPIIIVNDLKDTNATRGEMRGKCYQFSKSTHPSEKGTVSRAIPAVMRDPSYASVSTEKWSSTLNTTETVWRARTPVRTILIDID
jgi:hypothetical protein